MSNTEVKVLNAESSWWETACEGRTLPCNGGLAQLGEHLPYKQEVTGSSPVSSIESLAQLVEHLTVNQVVVSSSLTAGANEKRRDISSFFCSVMIYNFLIA